MKKLIIYLLTLLLTSCGVVLDDSYVYREPIRIETVYSRPILRPGPPGPVIYKHSGPPVVIREHRPFRR